MKRIEVIRSNTTRKGEATRGIARTRIFETDNILVGRSHIGGGVESDWHHHGLREVYGFILSGRLRFDYGRNGRGSIEARTGDFFHIPSGLIHRDVNPDPKKEAVVVNFMLGEGPAVLNMDDRQDT